MFESFSDTTLNYAFTWQNNYLSSCSCLDQVRLYKHNFFFKSEKISYAATKVNFSNSLNEETVYLDNGNNLKSK